MTVVDEGLLDPATGSAEVVGDAAVLRAMIDVEAAHLAALVGAGLGEGTVDWAGEPFDLPALAAAGADGGNPVIPLVAALRSRTPAPLADLVHLGLTSQDVVDSGLMLVAARAIDAAREPVAEVRAALGSLADRYRHAPAAGRTLGQQAAPTTIGLRFAVLLDGVRRTWQQVEAAALPLQLGGSVGTLAVLVDRVGPDVTRTIRRDVAIRLGLAAREGVWHVERSAVAGLGTALAAFIGALGRLGLTIAQEARTEIGELGLELQAGDGGSSAMPQKQNPVAAVLLVANARRAPGLAATLLGAQLALDERPAGDWHAEWQPLRELLRLAVESAALARQALGVLIVHPERAAEQIELGFGRVHAERAQQVLAAAVGRSRANELVARAIGSDDFTAAILAAAAAAPDVDAATEERLAAVTALGGPVGLSDVLIDAAIREDGEHR